MSPSVLKPEPGFTLVPMKTPADKKTNFGAVITDIDLDDISGMSFLLVLFYKAHIY